MKVETNYGKVQQIHHICQISNKLNSCNIEEHYCLVVMSSPVKSNVALRYLESINNQESPQKLPLAPSLKYNLPKRPNELQRKIHNNQDLDRLAEELNISPGSSPSKTNLLRAKFESPSATVSSLKTPLGKSTSYNTDSKNRGSPLKKNINIKDYDTTSNKNETFNNISRTPLMKQPEPKITTRSPPPKGLILQNSPGYEYLCRIQAIREWLQKVLDEEIPIEPVQLITYIKNGIHLAKLANVILPNRKPVFLNDSKLQFRHTENINRFFQLLDYLEFPDLFRFELTDLYDAKNVPKVWFCLHAMSYILNKSDPHFPPIDSLVGKLEFTEEDIKIANKSLSLTGLPNFSSADTENTSTNNKGYMDKFTSPVKIDLKRQLSTNDQNKKAAASNLPNLKLSNSKITAESGKEDNPFLANAESSLPSANSMEFGELDTTRLNISLSELQASELRNNVKDIIKIQSLIKGANFRYQMFVQKIILKSLSDEFTYFFSIIRGNSSRKNSIHRHREELLLFKSDITSLQSLIRMKLLLNANKYSFDCESNIVLQSLVRGCCVRQRYKKSIEELRKNSNSIITLQSLIRLKDVYYKSQLMILNKDVFDERIVEIQSLIRRKIYENNVKRLTLNNLSKEDIILLQSILRGNRMRKFVAESRNKISRSILSIQELQSIARGGISRTRLCNTVLIHLLCSDSTMNCLFAKIRGNRVRNGIKKFKDTLIDFESTSILPVQTLFRGVLSRFKYEFLLDDLYCYITEITKLQALIRGKTVRNERTNLDNHYNSNVEKVIKAQAILRSKFLQRDYQSLINMKNPPLLVIRRFAYLLSDNDLDYKEELELSNLKDYIIEKAKNNEDLEMQIENLDIKLGLLDKNKITVEDFIKHKNKFKNYTPQTTNGKHIHNFEKLNKVLRERVELYQSLFYFLQTKSIYLVRLLSIIPVNSKQSKTFINLKTYISELFPVKNSTINYHSREEYFYLKFIFNLMSNDIETKAHNLSDITKIQSCFWIDFFLIFNNRTYQRQHLKSIMGHLVSRIIEDDEIDFESDPTAIYHSMDPTKNEEILPQDSIKIPEVSQKFVDNLLLLRELSSKTIELLNNNVDKIPIHVRLISKHAHKLSKIQFPEKSNQQHLAVAGVIFFKHYIANIFQFPENYGFINNSIRGKKDELRAKNNLKHLNRVILQIFSMKQFNDNFLKPLNDFVSASFETTSELITKIIDVMEIDDEYEFNEYDDIVSHQRPTLLMNVSNMILVEKIVSQNIDIIAPSSDDQLLNIILKLDNLVTSAEDYVSLTEYGNITLSLNTTTKEDSIADSKSKSLFTQAKRCLLYIIRVQNGTNLLELLISGIKKEHETAFKNIVNQESMEMRTSISNEKKKAYYKTSLGDLTKITYHELKKMCLEIILQLESSNQLTRRNSYQELLNQIAIDIKTKDSQRKSRKQQLDIAIKTNKRLDEKAIFLKRQLEDYNSHIEMVLSQLQLKPKDKKIFNIIPVFSKQYFYHRQLRKSNRLPKFGSYKYSAKRLLEQKVLIDTSSLRKSSSSKLDFMFSCHQVGKFTIEAASGSVNIPGASTIITLDQLLNYQYENKKELEIFDSMVLLDTNNFIAFIFSRFYDAKKD